MYVLIAGNPADGFEFYGPFDDAESAGDWGSDYCAGVDWWVVQMTDPTTGD